MEETASRRALAATWNCWYVVAPAIPAGVVGGFIVLTTFVAKVAFGTALGRWILARSGSSLAGHRYWPMVLGVLITVTVIALFSFPLIPGILGWLLNLAIVLLGLSALWLWGSERLRLRHVPVG